MNASSTVLAEILDHAADWFQTHHGDRTALGNPVNINDAVGAMVGTDPDAFPVFSAALGVVSEYLAVLADPKAYRADGVDLEAWCREPGRTVTEVADVLRSAARYVAGAPMPALAAAAVTR